MTPAERAVIEAADAWHRACGPYGPEGADGTPLGTLADAVETLRTERAAAEQTRPWSLVVAEDEIYSVKTQKWYRVTKTVAVGADHVDVTAAGMAKPFRVPRDAQVLVRRSEMGKAVDVWAGIEVMSS